jgi:outer membrane protein assembly factor BamE
MSMITLFHALLGPQAGLSLRQRLVKTAQRWSILSAALVCVLVLTACTASNSNRSGMFEPYRVDLPQGNYITQEMLAQIRTGMSAEQVRFALGAPLLNNVFQPDRWNYVFRYKHAGGRVDLRRLVVYFKNDRVDRVEGDDLPTSEDGSDPFLPGYKGNKK